MTAILNKLRIGRALSPLNECAPWHLVSDVDGVLTDGKFLYSKEGKLFKSFGSHDADALNGQTVFSRITFVSSDFRGFEISNKRVEDMGYQLLLRNPVERAELVRELGVEENVVFIGDSVSDLPAMEIACISAAPKGSYPSVYRRATIKLRRRGGEGALAELVEITNASLGVKL